MQQDQTTMFFNKYSEDTEIPTVANRLADAIVEYEVSMSIPFNQINDEQIDDEVITEEEFLKNVVVQENKNGHNSYIFNLNRLHDGSFRS